jgi:hypothetical protein
LSHYRSTQGSNEAIEKSAKEAIEKAAKGAIEEAAKEAIEEAAEKAETLLLNRRVAIENGKSSMTYEQLGLLGDYAQILNEIVGINKGLSRLRKLELHERDLGIDLPTWMRWKRNKLSSEELESIENTIEQKNNALMFEKTQLLQKESQAWKYLDANNKKELKTTHKTLQKEYKRIPFQFKTHALKRWPLEIGQKLFQKAKARLSPV